MYEVFKMPVYAWKFRLSPDCNTFIMVEEGKQPNWFHRKMQYLMLGIKWERISK